MGSGSCKQPAYAGLLAVILVLNCSGFPYWQRRLFHVLSTTDRCFAGSLRRESYNRKLLTIAVEALRAEGVEVTEVDLADYPLPIMDEDLQAEHGVPEPARRLKQLFAEHDGFLLACPEYNSSITPLLKNIIDWASRREGDETPLMAYKGKVAALISASPSALGGLRGLVTVRSILGNIGALVLPDQVTIAKANEAFESDGSLRDPAAKTRVEKLMSMLAATVKKLKG